MSTPFVHSVLALAEEAKVRTSDLAREYGPSTSWRSGLATSMNTWRIGKTR
jgi:hypothetical protein